MAHNQRGICSCGENFYLLELGSEQTSYSADGLHAREGVPILPPSPRCNGQPLHILFINVQANQQKRLVTNSIFTTSRFLATSTVAIASWPTSSPANVQPTSYFFTDMCDLLSWTLRSVQTTGTHPFCYRQQVGGKNNFRHKILSCFQMYQLSRHKKLMLLT